MSNSKTSNRFLLSSAIALALVIPLSFGQALADGNSFKFKTPATCTTEGGSTVEVPPGRFIPEPGWLKLDKEYKLLEDRTTRLTAENKALKDYDQSGPGWKAAALIFVIGIAAGGYAFGR